MKKRKLAKLSSLFKPLSAQPRRFAVVALDMSLRSPGVAVVYQKSESHGMVWKLFAFGTKAKRHTYSCGTVLELFASSSKTSDRETDLTRYHHVVAPIANRAVRPLIEQEGFAPEEIQVAVESYAFPKRGSAGSNYKLHEVCGILKFELFDKMGITNIGNVSPAAWRSRTRNSKPEYETAGSSGTSNFPGDAESTNIDELNSEAVRIFTKKRKRGSTASRKTSVLSARTDAKLAAFQFLSSKLPHLDVLTFCNRKLGKNNNVPTPVQDLADAFCIAYAVVVGYYPDENFFWQRPEKTPQLYSTKWEALPALVKE